MNKIISKTVVIESPKMPPCADFIEKKIREQNINPLRWAIVNIEGNLLTISLSGETL